MWDDPWEVGGNQYNTRPLVGFPRRTQRVPARLAAKDREAQAESDSNLESTQRMNPFLPLRGLALLLLLGSWSASGQAPEAHPIDASTRREATETWRRQNPVWRGVHVLLRNERVADALDQALPALKTAGVNVVVAEVNYGYAFVSHPELRGEGAISRERASALARRCREHGIRLIPQFSSIGHQSWAESTFPLLTRYPELDETPGQYPGNKGIYCRSWAPAVRARRKRCAPAMPRPRLRRSRGTSAKPS